MCIWAKYVDASIFSDYKRRMNEDDFNDIGRILKYFKQHLDQHTHFLKEMTKHR